MFLPLRFRLLAPSVLLTVGSGCVPASSAAPTAAPTVEAPTLLAPLTAAPRTTVSLPLHSLTLRLPESSLWRMNTEGSYFHARHAETSSELWVKRWRQGERVSPERCAFQSALWRPDLAAPPEPPADLGTVKIPRTYHTRVAVHTWTTEEQVVGRLTAVGAAIRDCFVYVYETRAPRSPLARAVVEQRLNAMRQALLETAYTPAG